MKHTCPQCGGPMDKGARKTCRRCYQGSLRQKQILNKATQAAAKVNRGRSKAPQCRICPECGGPKSRYRQTCSQCYLSSERNKRALELARREYKTKVAKGLLKRTPEQRKHYGQATKKRWDNNPQWHEQLSERNRKFWAEGILKSYKRTLEIKAKNRQSKLGHPHTLETRAKMSLIASSKVPKYVKGEYFSVIAGKFQYQSSYELRFAKVLDCLGWQWEQNHDSFPYVKQDGLIGHYTPDFKILSPGPLRYYETKGYFRFRDQHKITQVQQVVCVIVLTRPLLEMFERLASTTLQGSFPKR